MAGNRAGLGKHRSSHGLGWRLSRSVLLWIALEAGVLVAVALALSELFSLLPAQTPATRAGCQITKNILEMLLALAAYSGLAIWVERRPPVELSLRAGLHLPLGFAVGIGLISSVYAVLWSLGDAELSRGADFGRLWPGLSAACFAAVFEELLMRAVLFRLLDEAFGDGIALVLSAAAFGLLHALNPGASLFSDAAIALEAGVLLALAFALTRNLWLAVGVHAGWNFAEGEIYGASVSGGPIGPSFLKSALHGPSVLTGGPFGPEASIISVGVCLLAAAGMGLMTVREGQWRPLRFRPTLGWTPVVGPADECGGR